MIKDFVGIYENAYTPEYCQKCVEYFDNMQDAGFTMSRQKKEKGVAKTLKDDELMFANDEDSVSMLATRELSKHFNKIFWENYYPNYVENFPKLKDSGYHTSHSFKIQKTLIGGGYHVWHYESSTRDTSNRLLAWMVYLNDVVEGGETEFLYQHMRVKPSTGTLLIWPASFTHTHRGNPPLSNDKYIITGWVEF